MISGVVVHVGEVKHHKITLERERERWYQTRENGEFSKGRIDLRTRHAIMRDFPACFAIMCVMMKECHYTFSVMSLMLSESEWTK